MNKNILAIIGLCLSLVSLNAAPSTGLPGSERIKARMAQAAASAASVTTPAENIGFRISPVRIVPQGSRSRTAALDNLFGDLESGRPLDIVTGLPTDGSQYTEVGNKVTWDAFAYSQEGEFLIPGESGWALNWVVDIFTKDGTDGISINETRFSLGSSDFQNVLGHTSQWWGNWYDLYARGYKAGINPNSPIVTGPGDQKVSLVRVIVWSRLFNGAGTMAGELEIQGFIESQRDPVTDRQTYGLKLEVDLLNGAHGERSVETNPVEATPVNPVLEITGNMVRLTAGNGSIYLESSPDLVNWTRATGFVAQGYELPVSGGQQFYRAVRQ